MKCFNLEVMNDLKVYANRKEIARMSYGNVPVIYRLIEGGAVKPPMHIDVVYPTRALQFIRAFVEPKDGTKFLNDYTAEDYVEFIDDSRNIREYSQNKVGKTMILHLN
jgi:hypothetical protein